ncbi:MAG: DNA-directed polymerase subunit beta, partial [Solirubrobacterales bacterium]|nr:DNA-directed polymerase subunit beta [Solirubrobacterales bacterium]
QLVEGKAIQIHPLVCTAFNADFDGDQMAVHLPLSAEAQAEARILMLSSNNILSPANGRPITSPTQDMVLGIYHLTTQKDGVKGEGRVFSSVGEAVMAFDAKELDLQAKVQLRLRDQVPSTGVEVEEGSVLRVETTLGRALFNETLPVDYPFVDLAVTKRELGAIVNDLAERYPKVQVAATLDALKETGFHWATRSGVTISIEDVVTPPEKAEILERHESDAEKVEKQYARGVITVEERRQELIEIWTKATNEVAKAMEKNFPVDNPVWMMVHSGARGNMMQVRQIAGMRGLVANPKGEIIPRPIKTNFREGLTVLEYFISTHGARKGLADTALRTADSGYLTRRLVDVSQDVIIRELDCGTEASISLLAFNDGGEANDNLVGRIAPVDITGPDGKAVLVAKGVEIGRAEWDTITAAYRADYDDKGINPRLPVRSVLKCEATSGVCQACYGRSMASGKPAQIGDAVGIIAAQSIGEPGTQLTMRTFHTGGVAGADITHGLPRVVELFEARKPKGLAQISEVDGTVAIEETDKAITVHVTDDAGEEHKYTFPRRTRVFVEDGQTIEKGHQLNEGSLYPHDVLRIQGRTATEQYLVKEVQVVYKSQGVDINDKHIELIVRQMLKKVRVDQKGDTEYLPGAFIDRYDFGRANDAVKAAGGETAQFEEIILGITKASLNTDSFLSAASFQETTKVLTDAALEGKIDRLNGLKENVIIGKLIPAATGLKRYRRIEIEPTEPLPRADEVGLLDSDDIAAELGLGGDGLGGFGFDDQELASLGEIGNGGGTDPGFAEELADLDVPADGDDR